MTDRSRRSALAAAERWWRRAAPIAFIGLGTWACWSRFSTNGSEIPGRVPFRLSSDFFNTYIPNTEAAAARLRALELPLWNPDACSGIPFFATLQTGVLYPGTWLAVTIPAHVLLPWLGLFHCFLGGVFAFLLFRTWGCERAAASAGALLFVFSCCIGQTMWPPAIATICWVPWLLFAVEKLIREGRARWWIALAIGAALQALAGFPQLLVYGYGVVAPYAALRLVGVYRARGSGPRQTSVRLAAVTTALVVGFGLASVQLLPAAELVQNAARADQLTAEQVHYLHPAGRFVSSERVLLRALNGSPGAISLGERGSGYLGTASLFFIAVALVARRREPLVWLLVSLGAVSLVLSDGYLGPWPALYTAFTEIPLLGAMRTPERLRFVWFLCSAGLSALGLSTLQRASTNPARRRVATLALAATGIALALATVLVEGNPVTRSLLALSLSLALCLGVAWSVDRRLNAACAALLIFLAIDLSLATATRATLRNIPDEWVGGYRHGSFVLDANRQQELRSLAGSGRLVLRSMHPSTGSGGPNALRRISCIEPLAPEQWTLLARKLGERREGRISLSTLRGRTASQIYDITSVHGIVQFSDGEFRFDENRSALPRAYFLHRTRVVNRGEPLAKLARGELRPRRETLVENEIAWPNSPGSPHEVPLDRLIPADIVEDGAERVVLEVEAPTRGLVVLTDTDYPGWQATVDGVAAPIGRANGLHRFVAVARGRHQIVFSYAPRSLEIGALVSAGSCAVLLVVAAAAARRGW